MSDANITSGRVESENPSFLIRSGKTAKSANDSHDERSKDEGPQPSRRGYVTRAQVQSIESQLNARQRVILDDIGRLGVASGHQLEQLHYQSNESARRLARIELSRLVNWQVLQRLSRQIGGVRSGSKGFVYALGVAGQRLLWPNKARYRAPWTPRPSYLRHALTVSDLYVTLRGLERSEVLNLATYDVEPQCWRNFIGPGGGSVVLKPDAFATLHIENFEDRYFIEVDLATEDGPRILTKARTYIRYWQSGKEQESSGVFPYVAWLTTTEDRRVFLTDTLAKLPAEHWQLFIVSTIDELTQSLSNGTFLPINNKPKEVNS